MQFAIIKLDTKRNKIHDTNRLYHIEKKRIQLILKQIALGFSKFLILLVFFNILEWD